VREDVGRHNGVDKVVGRMLLDGRLPLNDAVLVVSGRAGYEIVQKSINAGIPLLAAVGAPSSLAVALAREFNQTLVGFLRGERFNVYSAAERLSS
jgi:FdhD protein